jgi:hypothetical protein
MIEAASPDTVIEALCTSDALRIGFDGIDGSGKTTLANAVAAELQCRLFNLDDYVDRRKGRFLEFIDYPRLRADVSAEGAYVIEGVCLLHALQRAGSRSMHLCTSSGAISGCGLMNANST